MSTPMTKGPMPHMPYEVKRSVSTVAGIPSIPEIRQAKDNEAHSNMMLDSYERNLARFRKGFRSK
jgi:hypothetical protein